MLDPEHALSFDDVPVDVEAAVSGPVMRVSELLALRMGGIVVTPCYIGENISVFAGGARIGEGELSNRGRRLTLRMVRLGSGS